MLLRELIRFSSQHRTLYCYLILSVWIFLLIGGMYKYIGLSDTHGLINSNHYYATSMRTEESQRLKKYQQDCNPPQEIVRKEEGGIIEGWTLQGVLYLTRHGDRGPLSHVRGISSVDCSADDEPILSKYRNFLSNATSAATGHASWIKTGSFHGFPLLPPSSKVCFLGQLTDRGISQFLHIGEIIRQAYGLSLGLSNKFYSNSNYRSLVNMTNHIDQNQNPDEIVIYSTRYRRTFQSAMALLYALLPHEKWVGLNIQESHSLTFCFSDCACPKVEQLKKVLSNEASQLFSHHPAVGAVVQWIGTSLFQNPTPGQLTPLEVRDAVLALICHNAPLPCHKLFSTGNNLVPTQATSTTEPDNSDVINIDQDDVPNGAPTKEAVEELPVEPEPEGCVEQSHVTALMSYTHWQGLKEMQSKHSRRSGLLRAYGLIRHIVSMMLKIISGEKIKFVLYSGHDRTLQFILAALGLTFENPFIPYAARLNFELYKSEKDTQFYFRVLYNGKDVTREIEFCEGGKSLRVNRGIRGDKADLCPIENIIRFIHDDYFGPLNATNYKDACAIQKEHEF